MANPVTGSLSLCLECGMCCNGVIFARLRLHADDDANRLRELLPIKRAKGDSTHAPYQFAQPCKALIGGKCSIYCERPRYCREFECVLLQNVAQGTVTREKALRTIRKVKKIVAQIEALLQQCGEVRVGNPLATRFRRVMAAGERGELEDDQAQAAGELSQLMHSLNLLLARDFCPNPE